jgi:hypothetical protein
MYLAAAAEPWLGENCVRLSINLCIATYPSSSLVVSGENSCHPASAGPQGNISEEWATFCLRTRIVQVPGSGMYGSAFLKRMVCALN